MWRAQGDKLLTQSVGSASQLGGLDFMIAIDTKLTPI